MHRELGHEVEVVGVVGLEVEGGHVDAVGGGERGEGGHGKEFYAGEGDGERGLRVAGRGSHGG